MLRTDKEGKKDNHIFHWEVGDRAATERALAGADVVVKQESVHSAHPRRVH